MLRLLGVTLLSALAGMTAQAQDMTPSACPVGTYSLPGSTLQCVQRCPSPLLGYKGACVQMCPAGLLIDPMTATCVSTCPAGTVPTSSGVCTQEQMCPPGTVPYNGACVSMDYMCQIKVPGSMFNGQECICPTGAWMNRNRNTTSLYVESFCAANATISASGAPPPPVNCESYIANTVYNWQLMECQCSGRFPVIVPNPADPALPFGCAPPGTATNIAPCLLPMYFSFPEGQCVNMTAPSPYPTPSASPSLKPSASSSVSVRPSQNAPSPSSSPLKTGGGETPTATMTQRVPQEPSPSASVTAQPTQRVVQEPSPSITAKPADASATMTSKPSSDQPADMMSASMTPKPDDTQRPSESMTAKPSQRPLDFTAKPTPSAFPTKRPDSIWAVDATRPPLPSRPPMPSYSQRPLAMSAKPTPWRPRDPLPSDMPLPPYIQSSVKFPGANATKIQRPEVIQEIQASLACALNLALDNIRIQNVTVRRAGEAPRIIDVSAIPQLRSNGSAGCFRPAAAAAPRLLRGRSRSLQTDSSVDVDYYIVEPSADVLALSSAEFSTVLANSAPMTEIAASVGSSGVTAVATEGSAASTAPTTTSSTSSSSSGIQIGSVAGGVVGGIALCVAAFTAYKLATRGRRQPIRGSAVSHSRVILVDNTNPLQMGAGLGTSSPRLVGYAPTNARPGSRV